MGFWGAEDRGTRRAHNAQLCMCGGVLRWDVCRDVLRHLLTAVLPAPPALPRPVLTSLPGVEPLPRPLTPATAPHPSLRRFGVDVGVDYYALSFVRDARVIYELKNFLAQRGESVCGVGVGEVG